MRQVGGRLLEVRDERSGENLKHTVAAGFEQNQMEFAVPAVGFLRIAGIGLNAADGVVESPEQCGRHAPHAERNDVDLNEQTRFNELANVEIRDIHLYLDLRGQILRTKSVDGHAAFGSTVNNAHLRENRERFSNFVARDVEAFGDFRLGVNAAARLRLTKNVLVNIAKERFFVDRAV